MHSTHRQLDIFSFWFEAIYNSIAQQCHKYPYPLRCGLIFQSLNYIISFKFGMPNNRNFQYVSVRKVFVILILLIFSYIVSLIFALQMGENKSAVLLIINRGLNLPESEITPYKLMRMNLKNHSSAADVNLINFDLKPSINRSSNIESRDSDDISLNLVPPSKKWTVSQVQKTLALLGIEPPSKSNWTACNGRTYFFPKVNTIFTGVPKSGCTNWIALLLQAEGKLSKTLDPSKVNWIHGETSAEFRMNHVRKNYTNSDLDGVFSFAVVRNPWTRLVSGFRDKLSSEKTQGPSLRQIGMWVVRQIRHVKDRKLLQELYPTFDEFVRWLIKRKGTSNGHFAPQTEQLCMEHAVYDRIIPLEHSSSLSQEILTNINASGTNLLDSYDKASDPRKQKSTLLAKKWLSELDQDIVEQLYNLFRADFKLMNYSNFSDPDFPLPLQNV